MTIKDLKWETELLGKKSGSLIINNSNKINFKKFQFLSIKIPFGNEDLVNLLIYKNFYLVETAFVFYREKNKIDFSFNNEVEVKFADDKIIQDLAKIAYYTFKYSRFHRDQNIDNEIAKKSRYEWVINSYFQKRGKVLAAIIMDKPVGFLIYKENGEESIIDLIGVKENMKKRGIGKALIAYYLNISTKNIYKVTTQAMNLPSIFLYQCTGYKYFSGFYTCHWHK